MRQHILLFVNGQQHQVAGADAFLTLSNFLRLRLGLCGTKIVCSEGDCGSCSVLLGQLDKQSKSPTLKYSPIDSCIAFVFQLDGCHIVTVEGLGQEDDLNRVQEAMVDCHGSQCGFCTPGFVVAMTGLLEENSQPSESDWRHGLTGNLCRCTGYSPIIRAAKECNGENTRSMKACFAEKDMLSPIAAAQADEIKITAGSSDEPTHTLFSPTTIKQAVEVLAQHPDAKIVAGGTDVGVQFNKGYCDAKTWIDLNRIPELAEISISDGSIVAGARATWTDVENLVRELVPEFYNVVSVFGSPQIRNIGSIGGNIINASPIADSIPFLCVCEAELELTGQAGARTVNINDFYQDYKKFDLKPGELLTKITAPLPSKNRELRLYKVSRRRALDISTFTGAIWLERDGDTISDAGIAYGAVGPTVIRLKKTESFLRGKPLNLETMTAAGEIAVSEITPISDVRGGADFRLQLARNVLLKFYHQLNSAEALV